jgi:hypothetical protein
VADLLGAALNDVFYRAEDALNRVTLKAEDAIDFFVDMLESVEKNDTFSSFVDKVQNESETVEQAPQESAPEAEPTGGTNIYHAMSLVTEYLMQKNGMSPVYKTQVRADRYKDDEDRFVRDMVGITDYMKYTRIGPYTDA